MTPAGRLRAGRSSSPRQVPDKGWALMLKIFPWDIWVAAVLAFAVALAGIFGPTPAAFIVIYLGLCAYIVVQTINDEPK